MFCIQSQQTQSDWYRPTVFCWTGCVLQPPFNDSNHDDDNSWFSLSRSHHPSPNRGLIRNRLLCLWQWTMMSEFFLWQMSRRCEPSFMDLSVYLDGYSPEMVHCDNGLWIECPRSLNQRLSQMTSDDVEKQVCLRDGYQSTKYVIKRVEAGDISGCGPYV